LNKHLLSKEVQQYIHTHLNADVNQIALSKSPFEKVSSRELATQIKSKKKAEKKLSTWFSQSGIYYPEPLSIEQCSSETTAAYKATLVGERRVIDLTGGFGVDSYYFAKKAQAVVHCEINKDLSEIASQNAKTLGVDNISFVAGDGLDYIRNTAQTFDTIYLDPARRSDAGKVFMLKDCTPNVIENLDLLLNRSSRLIVKTSPLLDITAGLKELNHVTAVHIVSTKNECKELLFVMEKDRRQPVQIISTAINEHTKHFSFIHDQKANVKLAENLLSYLYEPDVALLKSGAFSLIGANYNLQKLHDQTQLYTSDEFIPEFPGRVFKIDQIISTGDLKKNKDLKANVLVRNYPDQASLISKKYKIKPGNIDFLIFTQMQPSRLLIIKATILQYY
jgi:precorrin-6B methylase 2